MPSRETWSKMVLMASTVLLSYTIPATLFAVHHQQTQPPSSCEQTGERGIVHFLAMSCVTGFLGIVASFCSKRCGRKPTLVYILAISILSVCLNLHLAHQSALAVRRCEAMATSDISERRLVLTSDGENTYLGVASRRIGIMVDEQALRECRMDVEHRFAVLGLSCAVALLSMLSCGIGLHHSQRREELQPRVTYTVLSTIDEEENVEEDAKFTSKKEVAVIV